MKLSKQQQDDLKNLGLIFGGAAISVTIILIISKIGSLFGFGF